MTMFANISAQRRRTSLDTDAAAYIAAVEAAKGSAVTSTQRTAINAFYVSEKAASRYSVIKSMRLPIWANAAANAIDMINLASGTFGGTITHDSGFVKSNGSTGHMLYPTTCGAYGLSTSSAGGFVLIKTADTRTSAVEYVGAASSGTFRLRKSLSNNINIRVGDSDNSATLLNADHVGVIVGSQVGGRAIITQQKTSGHLTLLDAAATPSGTLPNAAPAMSGVHVGGSTVVNVSNAEIGAQGLITGFTAAEAEPFSLSLKTLWETCTGLTLP